MIGQIARSTTVFPMLVVAVISGIARHADAQAHSENLLLAHKGTTNYSIVIASDAPEPVEKAASELSTFLGQMTGADFETVDDTAVPGPFEIVLGETNRRSEADIPKYLRPTTWEGFVILTVESRLYIMGGEIERGTLYGVYDFLERELGIRFLAPDYTYVPQQPTLQVEVKARRYDPPFEYRAHHPPQNPHPEYSTWMSRNRINSIAQGHGNIVRLGAKIHTFAALVPAGKYFNDNPKMFSLTNGKRTRQSLCLTNPETLRVATETAREWAGQAGNRPGMKYIVQIGQNDNGAYCQCQYCAAIGDEEGSAFSGPLLRFVNAIARELAGDFQLVYFETFAYAMSEPPPKKTKAEPNVIIWYAPIGKDCGRLLTDPRVTEDFNNLRGWAKVTKHLYIWEYPQSFRDFQVPYPSLWAIAENIPIYLANGATGYFPQGPNTHGADMHYLRYYMLAQMQWRPEHDARAIAEEFCRLYYGAESGREIMRYIDLLHDSWRETNRILHWGGYKDDALVSAGDAILTRATKLAETDEQKARIAEFRMSIWRLMLTQAFGNTGSVVSLPHQWWHRADDGDRATAEGWHRAADFDGWTQVEIPITDYQNNAAGAGPGWYATTFELPETNRTGLALHITSMDGTWDVYLDGEPVAQDLPGGYGRHREVPYVPLNRAMAAGPHTLTIHVRNGSGFYKLRQFQNPEFTTADPVTLVDMSKPLPSNLRAAAEGYLSASRACGMLRIFYGYSTRHSPYLEKLIWPKIESLLQAQTE